VSEDGYFGGNGYEAIFGARRLQDSEVDMLSSAASALETGSIDWSRLAEPQADQYDTGVVLQLASTTTSAARRQPYRRTPVGTSPSIFDGQVAVRHVYRALPEFSHLAATYPDAPADHPNLAIAAEYVRRWPLAFMQCQRLLEAIHPALDPRMPPESTEFYRGSSCHSYECLFGTMWSTIFCPLGLAEAIVHEMAHQKLRVLGVSFESATSVVGNEQSRLYESPVIKDRLRPMTAVLHAEYSYVYVTALDIHMLEAEPDTRKQQVLRDVLRRNLARIVEGYETLQRHFTPGVHGQEFIEGLFRWIDNTIDRAKRALGSEAAAQIVPSQPSARLVEEKRPAPAISKPLPAIDTSRNTLMAADREIKVLLSLKTPRIVVLGNVLSDEECDAIVQYSEPRLQRSLVVADPDGRVAVHENRTSLGAEFRRSELPVIARIEKRLAALAQWPVERGEGLQILRYGPAEEYKPHFDWIDPNLPGLSRHLQGGGQRLATFVLYLSQVEAGGATSFPAIGLDVMPQKGSALFFLNTDPQGVPDQLTLHAGAPVVSGVKFVANKWLRQHEG
jgi:prolyl 4-hydroxylase